jgi:hypothetical protein
MSKEEKIKIAITAGIASVALLILVLLIAFSGKKKNSDEDKLNENISEYASSVEAGAEVDESVLASGDMASNEAGAMESTEAASDASAENGSSSESSLSASAGALGTATASKTDEYSFFFPRSANMKNVYKGMKFDATAQLSEMYAYWDDGNMDAVRDLVHLERFEVMSFALNGTEDFYYYGETSGDGLPNGKGIAVYANDQYYFGEWSMGLRSGKGAWFSFYPSYDKYVVKERMYSGEWANDLPNGEGQDHISYDNSLKDSKGYYLQNAIGGFKNGLYDGELYVITEDNTGKTTEWDGTCTEGVWDQVLYSKVKSNGTYPVLSMREDTDRHVYLTEKTNKNNGVTGIIKSGNVRK